MSETVHNHHLANVSLENLRIRHCHDITDAPYNGEVEHEALNLHSRD